jgi:hypothetical protein
MALAPASTPAAVVEAFRASAVAPPAPAKTKAKKTAKPRGRAKPRRADIARGVIALLRKLSGIEAIRETSALETRLGLDADERRDLAAPLSGLVRRYSTAHVTRSEAAALATVRAAIDLVFQKAS